MKDFNPDKLLYSPNNAAHALDVSRSTIYELMKAGLIAFVAFSNERRIPAAEVKRLAVEGIPAIPKKAKTDLIGAA